MIEVIDATTEHIADLLRLLEENSMQGDWELVMTRRPGYFSPRDDFGEVYPALARDGDTLVGMCQLSIQSGWVNGEEARMGYLGSVTGRIFLSAPAADTGSLLYQYCGE